ncbi:MAG: hypothetical protein O9262_00800 [Cyclobacteriaceae bacterium]|nr:hypothetical protein [Cyclobacteriaceae bacterium]
MKTKNSEIKVKINYSNMKMNVIKCLIVLSITLGSCTSDLKQTNSELLTSSPWTAERKPLLDGKMPEISESHIFHKDGTYIQEFGGKNGEIIMTSKGKWNWTEENEIYYQINSVSVKDTDHTLEKPIGYYLQIEEVSAATLKTLERFEGDAWDSGFVKAKIYNRI